MLKRGGKEKESGMTASALWGGGTGASEGGWGGRLLCPKEESRVKKKEKRGTPLRLIEEGRGTSLKENLERTEKRINREGTEKGAFFVMLRKSPWVRGSRIVPVTFL